MLSVIITVTLTALLIYSYSHGLLQQELPPLKVHKPDPPADWRAAAVEQVGKPESEKQSYIAKPLSGSVSQVKKLRQMEGKWFSQSDMSNITGSARS